MVALRLEGVCRRSRIFAVAAAISVAFALAAGAAAASEPINVRLDQAKLIKLPERVSTVVVGNPLIADVAVQPGGMMVVTGKGFGGTNLVALDRRGRVLMERQVQVLGPSDNVVVVYRGAARSTYSCVPTCQPRITLGDAPPYFNAVLAETSTRNTQALGGTAPK